MTRSDAESLEQAMTALVGHVFGGGGIHAIVTRKVPFGDDGEEPHFWLQVAGCGGGNRGGLVVAALCFADAAGVIHMEWT